MKTLIFSVAVLGLVAFAGTADAAGGCGGSVHTDRTAEAPPPPPVPVPST